MSADDLLARIHVTLAESSSLTTQLRDTKFLLDEYDLASRPWHKLGLFEGPHSHTSVRSVRPSGLSKFFPVAICAIQERDRVCDGAGDDDGDGDGLELLLHARIAPHWCQLCCHYYPALATAANGSRTATRR